MSLILVTIMAMLGAGVIQLGSATMGKQSANLARMRALYIAEAGIAEAYLAVAQGRSGAIGSPDEPAAYGGGVYWVEAASEGDNQVSLTCTGLYGSGRSTLGATLERRVHPLGDLGLSAAGDLRIGARSTVAGIRSNSAPGGGTLADKADRPAADTSPPAARLIAGGDIYINAGSRVTGDLLYGNGGLVLLDPSALVTGSTESLRLDHPQPKVPFPNLEITPSRAPLGATSTTLSAGVHALSNVVIQPGAVLTLVGPSVVTADAITVQSSGALAFDSTAGAIELHVRNDLALHVGSLLKSPAGQAAAVGLFVHSALATLRGQPLALESSGTFHGILYAPDRYVVLTPQLHVVGALHGGSVELSPGARFTYDNSTRTSAVGLPSVPQQLAWYIRPLPDEPIVRQGLAPEVYLALRNQQTTPSSGAAREREVVLEYVDRTGERQSYTGNPELLDWSQVSGISDLAWINPADSNPRAFDDGIGLFAAIIDEDLGPTGVPTGGGIAPSMQANLDAWPILNRDFYDQVVLDVPFTLDEIAAMQSLVPTPIPALLTAIEVEHIAAGGTPW